MKIIRTGAWITWVVLFAGVLAPAFASPSEGEVAVVVDMTDAGRKIAPPTPEHPAFYVPVVIGYRSEGGQVAGEKPPPPPERVMHQLAVTLAEQGYRVVGTKTGEPTVLLLFAWGSWNPQIDKVPFEEDADPSKESDASPPLPTGSGGLERTVPSRNATDMLRLVAGNTINRLPMMPSYMTDVDRDAIRSDATENRYFVVVVAYDWAAMKQHKRVPLWTAKMSIRSTGSWFDEVFPALIKSGGPFFGRETLERQLVTVPLVREGHVELGELRNKGVVEDLPAPVKTKSATEEKKR
jgi:hypothetical protein